MDPEHPRLVARRRPDAPRVLATGTADDDRATAQLGTIALLHRREEGIEVDVEDGSRGHLAIIVPLWNPLPSATAPTRRPPP